MYNYELTEPLFKDNQLMKIKSFTDITQRELEYPSVIVTINEDYDATIEFYENTVCYSSLFKRTFYHSSKIL